MNSDIVNLSVILRGFVILRFDCIAIVVRGTPHSGLYREVLYGGVIAVLPYWFVEPPTVVSIERWYFCTGGL